jgi:hypothetical protein
MMKEGTVPNRIITCPYCQKKILLTEALFSRIKEDLSKESAIEAKKEEKDSLLLPGMISEESGGMLDTALQSISEQQSAKNAEKEDLKQVQEEILFW